jgi:predicted dehydrogenase/aryl-alcohol dehydrogenase-like predicted oxidoreductase
MTGNQDNRRLRWGIIGTGSIAHALGEALRHSETGYLLAVGSRGQESADKFADEFGAERRYSSYEALLADPGVDAVYIALPNHLHMYWAVRAAEAGKHILCEKPLASNYAEAMTIVDAARHHGVFLMEAFMYRCHPQTARLAELVRSGAIGELRLIDAQFSFNVGTPDYDAFRHQSQSAGGSIMDVGSYCSSMARLMAGAAAGKPLAEPSEIKGAAHIDPKGRVDEWAGAVYRFQNTGSGADVIANLSCGMMVNQDSRVALWGSRGHIIVNNPWFPGARSEILLYRDEGRKRPQEAETIEVVAGAPLYTIEADTLARAVWAGQQQAPWPAMTWDDTLGNMRALDRWRKDAGLVFDNEKAESLSVPFSVRPTAKRPLTKMRYGKVQGIPQPVSRLVMGTMVLGRADIAFATALLDHWVEMGGNCLDTAWVYNTEGIVGQWLKLRDNRKDIVLITKGAHTPRCTPEWLTRELNESLERFQTDYTDLYFMHRDNPDIPVGEFVDVLNEHKAAGRIRAFGGSNWTIERIQAANDYAAAHKLTGFTASSPNFALAVWNEPMWAGCVAAVDPASRAWYHNNQMPLFAWSSQASGLFTGRFRPDDRDDPAIAPVVRTWFNDTNFKRLERARQLAQRRGVSTTQIALAYVLDQPLNIYALIGPQTPAEADTSAQALDLELAPEELEWLEG